MIGRNDSMRKPPRPRPIKDERDKMIETQSKSYALEYVATVTQIFTIICLIKGNSAWIGSLSILFFALAFEMFYQHTQYEEKPYMQVGIGSLVIGILLILCFIVTG